MPPWVLRFRLCLTRFDFSIEHVPGKFLYTIDALSRAPTDTDLLMEEATDTEIFVQALVAYLPASKNRLDDYWKAQEADPICSQLIHFCRHGWPGKHQMKGDLSWYWAMRGEITFCDDLLLYGSRIVDPSACKLRHYKRFIMDIKVFRDAVREYLKLCGVQGYHIKLKPSSSHAPAVKRLLHPQRSHCCINTT